MSFADNLRQAMFDKRCKAVDVSRATKIRPSVISRYLSGTNQPSSGNLFAIAEYLGMSPDALLSSSEAPESSRSPKHISLDKDKIIAVQEEFIKDLKEQVNDLKKRVQEWEDWKATSKDRHAKGKAKADLAIAKSKNTLSKKTTPDGAIKKLFDLIDQSGYCGAFGLGMESYDEKDENHKWIFSEMERLGAEMKTIRSLFFSEEEIQASQNANMERVNLLPPKSKGGKPRKK